MKSNRQRAAQERLNLQMSIQLISISHKTAALHIRERFAFNETAQVEILEQLFSHSHIEECVIVATCNRTEVYTWCPDERREREIYEYAQTVLLRSAGIEDCEDIGNIFRFFGGRKAIAHLFNVACGLDSMVIGEDQILGQVKNAHRLAMVQRVCGTYLNTLFRYAVTAAKKVKTDTELSKTPVSTATICIKAAEEYLGGLEGKNVMIIGSSGKIGGIVLKNLLADYRAKLFVTTRDKSAGQGRPVSWTHGKENVDYMLIPYDRRYEYLPGMDAVISATSSPHYTLTYDSVARVLAGDRSAAEAVGCMKTEGSSCLHNHDASEGNSCPAAHVLPACVRRRAFMDLAVPLDIESRIGSLPGIMCSNIDDFGRTARENNDRKLAEAAQAKIILEDYKTAFEKWMIFQNSLEKMRKTEAMILEDIEKKDARRALDKFFFRVREYATPQQLEVFMQCLEPDKWQEG